MKRSIVHSDLFSVFMKCPFGSGAMAKQAAQFGARGARFRRDQFAPGCFIQACAPKKQDLLVLHMPQD